MRTRRVGYSVVGSGVAVFAGWASVAFACSPLPQVYSVLPEAATPGDTVVLRGQAVKSSAPVQIRWNGVNGKVLAAATPDGGGAFSVPVVVPDVAPGIYSLTLQTQDAGVNRTTFEVTAPAGSASVAPRAQLWPSVATQPSIATPESGGAHAAGAALLGFGLVALAGGSAVAVARRRRALAASDK